MAKKKPAPGWRNDAFAAPPDPRLAEGGSAEIGLPTAWLECLRGRLLRWLGRRVRDLHLVEDIVSDTVVRAWRRFREIVPWQRLWSWALRVATNLLSNARVSASRRHPADVDAESVVAAHGLVDGFDLDLLLARLQQRLARGDRETLDLLIAGVETTEEIAGLRGISLRTARASRVRIRTTAQQAWNDCRTMPSSASRLF